MASAKDIIIRPVDSKTARDFVRLHHYSGKVKTNSQIHLGVYLHGFLQGVMQYGPPNDRNKMAGIIVGGKPRDMIELNRMVFTEALPRNSESRAIGISLRLIRKHLPHIRFVISFADATMCGDGTIYRASGFQLTGIKPNLGLAVLPDGTRVHQLAITSSPVTPRPELGGRSLMDAADGVKSWSKYLELSGGKILAGHQLRYVKLLDPTAKLAVPVFPYSALDEAGARMYRGQRGRIARYDAEHG